VRVVYVDSAGDPRIADYRAVSEPALARQRGLFVAEGRLVVDRLITGRRFAIRSLLLTHRAAQALQPVLSRVGDGVPIYLGSEDCLRAIAGFHLHQGCLALGSRPAEDKLESLIDSARTLVALEAVGNADNVGSVFRNAAAFGVDAVLLTSSCADPLYRKSIRTSMAATLEVPFATMTSATWCVARLKAAGFSTLAFSPAARTRLQDFAASASQSRVALFFGSEGTGLSGAVRDTCDWQLRIPIRSAVDSLNVGVAVGIALSHLCQG
jgi:tRNA G18 (ribose-2'-O)-methylase SpoU